MVKGLTDEFLDLKSITMRLNKVNEERPRSELKMTRPATPGATGTVVVAKRPARPPTGSSASGTGEDGDDHAAGRDAEARGEEGSSDYIVASASYSKKGKAEPEEFGKEEQSDRCRRRRERRPEKVTGEQISCISPSSRSITSNHFAKKTKIPFFEGCTVISGPNGSGKSNIIDSILFVLALSSSRTLRAEKLTDLINLNSAKQTAEVSYQFLRRDENPQEDQEDRERLLQTTIT